MPKKYTDQQHAFVDALFLPEVKGCYEKAKRIAGYSENTQASLIKERVKELIAEKTLDYLKYLGPLAIATITEAMQTENPRPGTRQKVDAAFGMLDRTGISKRDPLVINNNTFESPVAELPRKEVDEEGE